MVSTSRSVPCLQYSMTMEKQGIPSDAEKCMLRGQLAPGQPQTSSCQENSQARTTVSQCWFCWVELAGRLCFWGI